MVSVAVQTDTVSSPIIVNQEVQEDKQKLQDELQSHISSSACDHPTCSPCKSIASSMCTTEASDEEFHYKMESERTDDSESEENANQDFTTKIVNGKKFIVFESQIDKLFAVCPQCCAPINYWNFTYNKTFVFKWT